ncbi:MAG: DNA-directed DNA polymerase [Nanoarchaeota archaeon]|nr:DNA-directed DNA polymerase [Nanoarchaeota archaeon]
MENIDFYPLTIDYIDGHEGGRGIIRIFGRTPDGKRICVLDHEFSHYFWVILEDKKNASKIKDKILSLKIKEPRRLAYATDASIHNKKYLSEDVCAIKVEVNNPKDVTSLRHAIKEMNGVRGCKETDIPFHKRYLIDKKIDPLSLCNVSGEEIESNYTVDKVISINEICQKDGGYLEEPRVLSFDIEVYNKKRVPNSDEDPIVMIAFYGKNFKKVIVSKKYTGAEKYVEFVKDERELLTRFIDVVNSFKPDYLAGYFSDGFDLPYIKDRFDEYNMKLKLGLDESIVKFNQRGNSQTARITGIPHIDIFKFIRRIVSGELNLPSYDLDTVSKHLLGRGKSGADIGNLYNAWDKGGNAIEEYVKYNLVDAERTYELTEKMLPHLNEFIKLCGLPPEEISRMSYGQLVENYVLKNIDKFNEIAPNRPYGDVMKKREMESVEGAFVLRPGAGLYKNIAVYDFKSLYPTIISAHNICPSTLTQNKIDSHETPSVVSGKNETYRFSYKYDGIFPTLIKDILIRRTRVKDLLKKNKKDPVLHARQYSLKILANSAYGYFAFSGARWYCKECAASTTAYGRDYIKNVIDKAEKSGLDVIYSDTDSVFLSVGKSMKNAEKFVSDVNRDLPSLMELELEGYYPRGIFVMKKGDENGAKKKYALVDENNEIKVVGFETVRGDWSKLAREVQKEVLKIILVEDDVKKAVDYVRGVIIKINSKKIPIEKMIIKKKLTRDVEDYNSIGPHVRVAKILIKRGEIVGAGSEIEYVVQEGKGNIGERSLLASDAKSYDPEYYINNQVLPVVERIFSAVGYEKEDLKGEHKQRNLSEY